MSEPEESDPLPLIALTLPPDQFVWPAAAEWLSRFMDELGDYLATRYEATAHGGGIDNQDVRDFWIDPAEGGPAEMSQASISIAPNEVWIRGGLAYVAKRQISPRADEAEVREIASWIEDNLLGIAGGGLRETAVNGTYPIESWLQTPSGILRGVGYESWELGAEFENGEEHYLARIEDGRTPAWQLRPRPNPYWRNAPPRRPLRDLIRRLGGHTAE